MSRLKKIAFLNIDELSKDEMLNVVFEKPDIVSKFKELRNQRNLIEKEFMEKDAAVNVLPNSTKNTDFNLSLADYLYKELKKMKFKITKPNDLAIHLAFDRTIDPRYNTIILDCLDGKVYLRGEGQRDRQIGRLRNFRGTRASDAYHCMKSSIERILRKINKYNLNAIDLRTNNLNSEDI